MEEKLPRRIAWFAPWTWKRRWQIVVGLTLAFVVYPLSIGPAYYLVGDLWLPEWCFAAVYLPVIQLAWKFDATREMLIAYLFWFYPYVPFD